MRDYNFRTPPSRVVDSGIPEIESQNEMFKDNGYTFEAYKTHTGGLRIRGPLCTKCFQPFSFPISIPGQTKCSNSQCTQTHNVIKNEGEYKSAAHESYLALKRTKLNFINWESDKTEISDNDHKIIAYFTNKNGRKLAVVNIIARGDLNDKSQFFIEPDTELVRHDPKNQYPGNIISKATFEFRESTQEHEYKKQED